jgi:hypothetical protein
MKSFVNTFEVFDSNQIHMSLRELHFVFQFCVFIVLRAACVCSSPAQNSVDINRKFTPEQLIEDVGFYVKTLEEAHINPYANVFAVKFRAHAESIKAKIRQRGAMTQKEFWWLFAPLAASIGDSHTLVMETRFFIKAEDDPTKYLPFIDVRKNGGGSSQLGDALIDMFNAKPYRVWTSKWKRSVFYAELLKSGNVPLPKSLIEKYLAARPGEVISDYSETVNPGGNPLCFNGRVYVLSGAKTFSSGVMFLGVIKDNKLAKIVGEETNEPACMFGEMDMFWLPHSRLRVAFSVKSWTPPAGSCNGTRGVVPDVVVRKSVNDFLTGRDVILERALGLIKRKR